MKIKFRRTSPGITLIEMLIAVSILSIAFLGMMAAFGGIAASIQQSKLHTLASNLAQEKMQVLKQISYYRLMITTSTAYRTEFSPSIPYDTSYYAPETMFEGGITFQRLTYVQMASEVSGNLTMMGAVPDTGMKAITVTVTWKQGNMDKVLQIRSIRSNPDTVMANATFTGYVKNTANQPIPNATVTVAENMGWQDITDTNGSYRISLYPGNYSIIAAARGFFSQTVATTVNANQTVTQDFVLGNMSSGTITGTVWTRDHLVISQVVASTVTVDGVDQEFTELYNPTTSYIQLGMGFNISKIRLMYQNEDDASPSHIPLSYTVINANIAPNGYFLIANTNTITACGITRAADAVYSTPGQDIIKSPDAGGLGLQRESDLAWLDRVGWDRNSGGKTAPLYETAGIDQNVGFEVNEQYVRRTSTSGVNIAYGRVYDSDNNNVDFIQAKPMQTIYPPRSSLDSAPSISGTPMIGAVVTCNDDLSYPAFALAKGNIPYAEFNLLEVSTGTNWTVLVTSYTKTLEISSVSLTTNGQVVGIPNASTDPIWPNPGYYACYLSSDATGGYISGRITDASGIPISPAVVIKTGTEQTAADTGSGKYILSLATGTYSLTANPNNANPQYISMIKDNINVNLGQITSDVDFILSRGGQLRGWVTRDSINPLPGVSIVAMDINGIARAQDISRNDGKFLLINLATGTYAVETVLDSGEKASPVAFGANVVAGSSVFVGTFTVTGAFGTISGMVQESGSPISTGVLVIASTATITTPPTISAATLSGSAYYLANSYENGTYAVDVRGSTTTAYNVYAYYPKLSGQTVIIKSSATVNVSVSAGQKKTGVNFSW